MSEKKRGEKEHTEMEVQSEAIEANADAIRTVGARELLGGRGILRIEHGGEVYTLRLTRNNRLILTK